MSRNHCNLVSNVPCHREKSNWDFVVIVIVWLDEVLVMIDYDLNIKVLIKVVEVNVYMRVSKGQGGFSLLLIVDKDKPIWDG